MTDYMFQPSDEQERIINYMRDGKNVYTEAVPGAGKTTTGLAMGERMRNKKIIYLTFSAQLKLEGKEKVKKYKLPNIEMQSYHSLGNKYYSRNCHDDKGMKSVINKNMKFLPENPLNFQILVLDEIQDMTKLFFDFIMKFIKDYNKPIQLLILGDRDQNINKDFKGSDYRFLTLAPQLFTDFDFVQSNLTKSFRLTKHIASFVNENLLGYDKIKADKNGPKVKYIVDDTYSPPFKKKLYGVIRDRILNRGYKYEDIFILSNSVKSDKSPIVKFENYLSEHPINNENIDIYMPRSDTIDIKNSDMSNKVVITTYHQSKGRERKLVIVFSCDEYLYKLGVKKYEYDKCSEDVYVAMTRATEELIVIHNNSFSSPMRKLPYFKNSIQDLGTRDYCNLKLNPIVNILDLEYNDRVINEEPKLHNTTVTDLTKFIKEDILYNLSNICDLLYRIIDPGDNTIKLKNNINGRKTKKLTEQVSDINGIIIPAMWEYENRRETEIYKTILRYINKHSGKLIQNYDINYPCSTVEDWLRMGNLYISVVNGCENNLNQIKDFNWLGEDKEICLNNLRNTIPFHKQIQFEVGLGPKDVFSFKHKKYGTIEIGNRMDVVDQDIIYELKCTKTLTIDHKLQLLVYSWLWNKSDEGSQLRGSRKFRLFNIVTGNLLELDSTNRLIEDALELLFLNKYSKIKDLTDEEFINMIKFNA